MTRARRGSVPDRAGVVDHNVERHRDGVLASHNDVAQGIAHQDGIDAAAVNQPGHSGVVGGENGNLLAELLLGDEIGDPDAFTTTGLSRMTHGLLHTNAMSGQGMTKKNGRRAADDCFDDTSNIMDATT